MCHYCSCLYEKTSSAYNTCIEIIVKSIVSGLGLGQSRSSSITLLPPRDNISLAVSSTLPPALDYMEYKVFGPELCMAYHVIYICYSIVLVGPQDKVPKLLEGHTRKDEIYSMVLLRSAHLLAGSWEH